MTENSYDVVIIGAGQAGIPLAYALAKAGKPVALAEKKDLGGSCVNFGCTPTKGVIAERSRRTVDLFSRHVQIHEKHEWWLRDILEKKGDGLAV